jgi:hypothetical protein
MKKERYISNKEIDHQIKKMYKRMVNASGFVPYSAECNKIARKEFIAEVKRQMKVKGTWIIYDRRWEENV